MNESVVIDCDTCIVRSSSACGDCVVTVLLGSPPAGITLDGDEVAALDVLADEGLVPPLRLQTRLHRPPLDLRRVTPLTSGETHAS